MHACMTLPQNARQGKMDNGGDQRSKASVSQSSPSVCTTHKRPGRNTWCRGMEARNAKWRSRLVRLFGINLPSRRWRSVGGSFVILKANLSQSPCSVPIKVLMPSNSHATSLFAISRPTFYAAQAAWEDSGIVGLLPEPTGPRHAHKLSEDTIALLEPLVKTMSSAELAVWLHDQQHLTVHPRSIERALKRSAQKGGSS